MSEPYENNVLEGLDIFDLQWLIFVLKPHKSIAVDLVFLKLVCKSSLIIITTIGLKIEKKHSLFMLYIPKSTANHACYKKPR